MPWIDGEFRPWRRNSQGIKCAKCHRVFAGELIPTNRICRDCRIPAPVPDNKQPMF